MLTLGIKEQVINMGQLDRITILDAAYAELTTEATVTASGKYLKVEGFGMFDIATSPYSVMNRAVDRSASTLVLGALATTYTVPTVETSLVVDFTVESQRNNSDFGRNFIRHAERLLVEVTLTPEDDTLVKVYDKVAAALAERVLMFPTAQNSVVNAVVGGTTSADATLTLSTNDFNIFVQEVNFLASTEGNRKAINFGKTRFTEATANVTLTRGSAGVNTGKWLEENVQMSTYLTNDAYAIRPQEVPLLNGLYSSFYFKFNSSNWAGEHTSPIFDHSGYSKTHEAEIWIQEDGVLGSAAAIAAEAKLGLVSCLFQNSALAFDATGTDVANSDKAVQLTAFTGR